MARRLLGWPLLPQAPVPPHPYRDSALFHGALAVLIVVIAWASGANVGKALAIAAAYFVAATLWSWWRFRARVRRIAANHGEK